MTHFISLICYGYTSMIYFSNETCLSQWCSEKESKEEAEQCQAEEAQQSKRITTFFKPKEPSSKASTKTDITIIPDSSCPGYVQAGSGEASNVGHLNEVESDHFEDYEAQVKRRSSRAPNLIDALSATEERRLIQLSAAERIKCDRAHLERQGLPHNATLGRHRSDSESNVDPLMC